MLKWIATARSAHQNKAKQESTGRQKNKVNYNTDYIDPALIGFFGVDYKEIKTQTEKRNIHYCKKYCTD